MANLTKTRLDLKTAILTRKPLSPESTGEFYYNEYAHDICTVDEVTDLAFEPREWSIKNCLERVQSMILIDGYLWHKAGAPILYASSEYQTAGRWEVIVSLLPIDSVERNFVHHTKGDAMFSLETEKDIILDMFPEVENIKLPDLQILISDIVDESVTEVNFINCIKERLDNWWMHISRQRSSEDLELAELNLFVKLLTSVKSINAGNNPTSINELVSAVSNVINFGIQVEDFKQILSVYEKIKSRTDVIDITKIEESIVQ